MKLLMLLAGLGLSGAVKAQGHAQQLADTVNRQIDILSVLNKSANPRYLVLTKATSVYLQAADTLTNRVAKRLRRGRKVYIRKFLPTGYLIALPTQDKQYYLPAKVVTGLQVNVEI